MSLYFGTVTGFNTVLAISTEAFCRSLATPSECFPADYAQDLSYILPLLVRILQRLRGEDDIDSAYSLGKFGLFFNVAGMLYLIFAVITFNLPSVSPVTSSTMNYTSAALGACILIAAITWFTTGHKHFSGPQRGHIIGVRQSTDSTKSVEDVDVTGKVN